MRFMPAVVAPSTSPQNNDFWFLFAGDALLVKKNGDELSVPTYADVLQFETKISCSYYLGAVAESKCFAGTISLESIESSSLELVVFRQLIYRLPKDLFRMAGVASQVILWDQTHQFCGQCGSKTDHSESERAKICPKCSHTAYPRLSPSIIVSIVRKDQILLARSPRFPKGMFSVLAGFVEPGESLEECVEREIFEEVGIQVNHIRYFGSENWPFPHSLMIGFQAEYVSGEIKIDGIEIEEAHWYGVDELPMVPKSVTISGRLIQAFVDACQEKKAP